MNHDDIPFSDTRMSDANSPHFQRFPPVPCAGAEGPGGQCHRNPCARAALAVGKRRGAGVVGGAVKTGEDK